jgi:hypothetical protein
LKSEIAEVKSRQMLVKILEEILAHK